MGAILIIIGVIGLFFGYKKDDAKEICKYPPKYYNENR